MKEILFYTILILFMAVNVYAGPYLTCDPQEGVTKYELTLGGSVSESDANADGSAWHDLVNAPEGKTSAELRAGGPWTIDDDDQIIYEWSDPHPFVLGRPSVSSQPNNLSLKESH